MGQVCVPSKARITPENVLLLEGLEKVPKKYEDSDREEQSPHKLKPKGVTTSTQHETTSSSLNTLSNNYVSPPYLNLQQQQNDSLENILVMINSEQLQLLQQIIQRGPPQDKAIQTESHKELRRFWSHKTMQPNSFRLSKDDLVIGNNDASHSSSSSEDIDVPVRSSTRSMKNSISSTKKLRRKRSNGSTGARNSFQKERNFENYS